jgi:ADP-ribose pyrophosphatase YjhB (NUDIX family)
MTNGKGTHGRTRDPRLPTEDEEIGADELRAAAERAWRNRWGIPGGTPEADERSADRAGRETDDVELEGGRTSEDSDDDDDKKKV